MAAAWTDDRVAQLRRLWGQGQSASEIAGILGAVTRNGVIGKANRLHLARDAQAVQPQPAAVPVKGAATSPGCTRKKRRRLRPASQLRPAGWSPFPTCQYLHGEPSARNFCGAPVLALKDGRRSSYCPDHHALCTQADEPRGKPAA